MDLPVDGLFGNSTNSSYTKHLLVGEDSIPVHDLSPFMYNDTESGDSYAGLGTATRWISLMTLATPAEDTKYSQKGDPLLWYNFDDYVWNSGVRQGTNCSDSAEDFLSHVVNNHYFMDHGLQAAYTAGMYFLFQNAVERDEVNMTTDGSQWSLQFDGNEQWMDVTVSIPLKSLVCTFAGLGLIVVGAVCAVVFSHCGRQSLLKQPQEITIDMIAEMMRNDSKYPPLVLERRFQAGGLNGSFHQFRIDGLRLCNEATGEAILLPQDLKPGSANAADTTDSEISILEART